MPNQKPLLDLHKIPNKKHSWNPHRTNQHHTAGNNSDNNYTITKTRSYQLHSTKGNTLFLRDEEPFLHDDALPSVDGSLHFKQYRELYIVLFFRVQTNLKHHSEQRLGEMDPTFISSLYQKLWERQ